MIYYGIIAVVIGYLLGSIPTAYIVTRLVRGEDVRRLGGGNVGGLNVYREVGLLPAVVVAIVDLGKGAAAVRRWRRWSGITGCFSSSSAGARGWARR
jgi:acyl-phosphate glycerol 3-phosphate acyltransferase